VPAEKASPSRRRRRTVEDARREILDAAERLLVEGGPDAVRVQTVARAVGMTDAAVHYHFGSREGLLDQLLREVARRMREEFTHVVEQWDSDAFDVESLVDLLDDALRVRGYARLTAWMRLTGRSPRGSGLFRPQAELMHAARTDRARRSGEEPPPLEDSLHVVTLLNLVTWADPLVGDAWRRAVGLPATAEAAERFRGWFAALVQEHLDRPPQSR
jgi:AcrR family transcriptional regulator